jgi:hypothetical protein
MNPRRQPKETKAAFDAFRVTSLQGCYKFFVYRPGGSDKIATLLKKRDRKRAPPSCGPALRPQTFFRSTVQKVEAVV